MTNIVISIRNGSTTIIDTNGEDTKQLEPIYLIQGQGSTGHLQLNRKEVEELKNLLDKIK